ncbi:type IV pilin protein [Ectobacillus sp. sgz5001026]|uniref:type IV pilin protein n=1 Tax=Ectobacillus sp. sgz5001026 TaxID=3242473 RepID=UPI0036D330E9
MLKKFLKNEKGLTLVELLAVIVILGIVAAIAIPSIGSIIQKSKEDGVKADAITVINSAKTYVAANGVPAVATAGDKTTTITSTMLQQYVSNVKLTSYSVTVSTDGTTFSITGTGVAGGVTITFTNATIDGINTDTGYGTNRTIAK